MEVAALRDNSAIRRMEDLSMQLKELTGGSGAGE
jgi:hypothetical protein